MAAGHNSIYDLLQIPVVYHSAAAAGVSALALTGAGLYMNKRLKTKLEAEDVLPEPKFSAFNALMEVVKVFRGLCLSMIGSSGEKYLSIILCTFLLVLVNNLSGFVPGFISPSESLINNLSMGLVVFVAYHLFGFREHGIAYVKQFTGGLPPPGYGVGVGIVLSVIAVMVFAIELIGHVVRPFSLSLRLWGTITGDHALLSVSMGVLPILLPVVAMTLGLLVSVVQALVFSLLSTVYIKLAVSHDH